MTTELTHAQRKTGGAPGRVTIFATRLVLFWERFWPAILPALAPPFLILVISLFDLWRYAPVWLHWTSLALAAAATITMLWRYLPDVRWPSRRAAQARLEADGDVRHAALQALDDRPFDKDAVSPQAALLWRAHLDEMREHARDARLAGMRATAHERDPYGLRFTAMGLLAVALAAAGGDWRARLATAPGAGAGGGLVADLWIEPPDYTGKPPIYLARAGEPLTGLAEQVNAPEGSVLIAQVNGRGRPRLGFTTVDGEERIPFERNDAASRARFVMTASGAAHLRLGPREARWPIGVLADDAPTVQFIEPPAATGENLLGLAIVIKDDYGVTHAQLQFRLDPDQERPLDAPMLNAAALGEVRFADLDGAAGAAGEHRLDLDLQADPWAGLGVLAKIIVTDGAGQTGETEEVSIALPARAFFNPLARAVIEQRQTLAVAATDWPRAGRSFDALTLAPEFFYDDMTDYLLLRTAFWRVMRQNGDNFDDAVEKFWPLALQLEDQALELARQRLEAAQEALRRALEEGASDEEISRLVEALRQAMNDYLTALAQSGMPMDQRVPQNAQMLDQSDLDAMLDAIRDLASQGAQNAARQMLSDLENMLNNLRLAQGGQGQGKGMGQGEGQAGAPQGGPAGKAGELIGRQRELADQSFERGRTPGANGDDLAGQESGLGGDLDALIGEIQGQGAGADPGGDAARALGQARNDMRQAEGALGNGDFDAATGAMERAIGRLREGAEKLAREQMRQAQGNGPGREGPNGRTDPLGRPYGYADGDGVDVPEESAASRTRAVIEELRRRLGEQGRSKEEIDYLERLLERF